jgi:hypothetical protein
VYANATGIRGLHVLALLAASRRFHRKTKVVEVPSIRSATIVHYINENKSDMRGIKPGWYTMDDDGDLSSGPFSSYEECLRRTTQPTS